MISNVIGFCSLLHHLAKRAFETSRINRELNGRWSFIVRFQSDLFALASVVMLILQDSIYLFTLFDKLTIIDYFKMPPSVKSSNFRKTIFIHAFFRILFWALLPLGSRQVLRARRDEAVESAVISQKAP